ncbi:MAG: PilX N-terminal domain-containing pilus assembly protein [Proteobacteria bacterium]|nr:PilX N-terminal domain-containing pilus assembly protein [Pseudomonadota bacterium]
MALIVCMLVMALMGLMGLAALRSVSTDRQVGGYEARSQSALYAAESGIAAAMRTLATANLPAGVAALEATTPDVTGADLGAGGVYGSNAPSFRGDDTVPDPIRYLGVGGPCEEWEMSIEAGGPQYLYSIWDVRMQGEQLGAVRRIQASATRCYAYDS